MTEQRRRRRPPAPRDIHPGGAVVIGMRELYDLLLDVRDTVVDLAADRDTTAAAIGDLRADEAKLSERVTQLERWRWLATGAAAVAGGIVARLAETLGGG